MRRDFLIDTDTASDDAVALIMALRAPDVQVRGISTVAGNVPVQQATCNALYVAGLCGSRVPVYSGAARPIWREHAHAEWFHGKDGLGDQGYPEPRRAAEAAHAVDAIAATVHQHPGIVLVTLGPVTNVALALLRDPGIAGKLSRCVVMGGKPCCEGNLTPAAEYNIWMDPEAARVVLRSGLPIELVGWHLSRGTAVLNADDIAQILAMNTPLARFAVECNSRARGLPNSNRGDGDFPARPGGDVHRARSNDLHFSEPASFGRGSRERPDSRNDCGGPPRCCRGRAQPPSLAKRAGWRTTGTGGMEHRYGAMETNAVLGVARLKHPSSFES